VLAHRHRSGEAPEPARRGSGRGGPRMNQETDRRAATSAGERGGCPGILTPGRATPERAVLSPFAARPSRTLASRPRPGVPCASGERADPADCPGARGLTGFAALYYNSTSSSRQESDGMAALHFIWDLEDDPEGNVRHIAEHGVTPEEVEEVLIEYYEHSTF